MIYDDFRLDFTILDFTHYLRSESTFVCILSTSHAFTYFTSDLVSTGESNYTSAVHVTAVPPSLRFNKGRCGARWTSVNVLIVLKHLFMKKWNNLLGEKRWKMQLRTLTY